MSARKRKEVHNLLHKCTEAVQDSHLRLLSLVPAQGEKVVGGRTGEGDEWQGGTGGRVEFVGACLTNSGKTMCEQREIEPRK